MFPKKKTKQTVDLKKLHRDAIKELLGSAYTAVNVITSSVASRANLTDTEFKKVLHIQALLNSLIKK